MTTLKQVEIDCNDGDLDELFDELDDLRNEGKAVASLSTNNVTAETLGDLSDGTFLGYEFKIMENLDNNIVLIEHS